MNIELFAKVDAEITLDADRFSMEWWEDTGVCGTTRCVAGHAIYQTTGRPLYGEDGLVHESVKDLADDLGIDLDDVSECGGFEGVAAKLLGIDHAVAVRLFYTDDDTGRRFVALAAAGRKEEALALLNP